jgi:hypothetical protein
MLIFGVRYEIDPPELGQQLRDALTHSGWAVRDDGALVGLFGSAQDAATTFDGLARSVGARPTARYVFEHDSGRFVPVKPLPDD